MVAPLSGKVIILLLRSLGISLVSGIRIWREWDNVCVYLPYLACVFRCICARCLIECNVDNERVHIGFISLRTFFLTAWSSFLVRQTLDRWLGFSQLLHAHAGHFSWWDPVPEASCWWLPQPAQAWLLGLASILSWLRHVSTRTPPPLLDCGVFFCLRYVHSRAEAASGAPAIEFWSCAYSNASAWRTFCPRDLTIPALASRSTWSVSVAIPRMIWSIWSRIDHTHTRGTWSCSQRLRL